MTSGKVRDDPLRLIFVFKEACLILDDFNHNGSMVGSLLEGLDKLSAPIDRKIRLSPRPGEQKPESTERVVVGPPRIF